jgi:uncharacterized protein YeaO (DUF488 family)
VHGSQQSRLKGHVSQLNAAQERGEIEITAYSFFIQRLRNAARLMAVRIVRLGTPRLPAEGLRLGTVRRPPRGVAKERFASENWYDLWFPNLAPSPETLKLGQAAGPRAEWEEFARRYTKEMGAPHAVHDIQLLAALSHSANFSVGCYCEHEDRCHRSILKRLLLAAGANVEPVS